MCKFFNSRSAESRVATMRVRGKALVERMLDTSSGTGCWTGISTRWSLVLFVVLGMVTAAHAGPDYAGDEACGACHAGAHPDYASTIHGRVLKEGSHLGELAQRGCEACHGPAQAHVDAGGGKGGDLLSFGAADADSVERENAACLQCHTRGSRTHWTASEHEAGGLACTSCHDVKRNRSVRFQLRGETELDTCRGCHQLETAKMTRNSHMPVREGAMSCSSCHQTHGAVAESLVRHDTVNDGCLSCHAEKRGPFLWEHAPVTENCLSCHDAHGTVHRAMLKVSQPRLCQSCHVATLHPSLPRTSDDHFVLSRSCGQCHVNIHGSNHPSGFGFTR